MPLQTQRVRPDIMTDQLALIIEDDFDASQIFSKALEVQGLKTEAIHDGEKALERLRTAVPFVIVLDLHLPNVDGTEILAWVRSMPALKETLVIVVTADARLGEMLEDKADLVLLKPATFTQIRDFTARLISRKRRAAEEAKPAETASSVPVASSVEDKPTVESTPTSEAKPAEVTPAPTVVEPPAAASAPSMETVTEPSVPATAADETKDKVA
jgi:CheY-like chemotaxis protein